MTGPVSIDDIKTAGGGMYNDLGAAIKNGIWNKYAKWHPVKSTAPHLGTVDERDAAGRSSAEDVGMRYGVRGGAGNVTSLSQLHSAGFSYEQPSEWSSGIGYAYRASDLVHPALPTVYGYRGDAYIDLTATIKFPAGNNIIALNQEAGLIVNLNYSPHSEELRNEMLSIKDFLINNQTQYDPSTCYPCVFITLTTGVSYMHCLYKGNGTAPAQLGTGQSEWNLNTVGTPSGWVAGNVGTISVILVKFNQSTTSILYGTDGYNIANWITISSSEAADSQRAWTAWFSGVPDACGVPFSTNSSALGIPDYMVNSVSGGALGVTFSGTYSNTYSRECRVDVSVQLFTSQSASTAYATASMYWDMVSIRNTSISRAETLSWDSFSILPGPQDITYYATVHSTITDAATHNVSNGYSFGNGVGERIPIVCPKNSGTLNS